MTEEFRHIYGMYRMMSLSLTTNHYVLIYIMLFDSVMLLLPRHLFATVINYTAD